MQLIGRAFEEGALLGIARRYEEETDWTLASPGACRSSARLRTAAAEDPGAT